MLLSIEISFFYNFVMHTFFGEMSAAFIDWEESPFQAKLVTPALASHWLGFSRFAAASTYGLRALSAWLHFCGAQRTDISSRS
jgi:hypothetical protein